MCCGGTVPTITPGERPSRPKHDASLLPPSASAVLGAYTANGSWLAGGGHMAIWKQDKIRYNVGLGYGSINLEFYGSAGVDFPKPLELKNEGRSVIDYDDAEKLDRDAVIDVECDIWIPAARPDVVNEDNVQRLNTRLVVEGANIPFTHRAEKYLHDKGVLCIPDFIANAGGVICAAMEYHGASQAAALQAIEEKLRRNTAEVLEVSKREHILPREASMALAMQRINRAMSCRRYSLFSTAEGWI